VAVILYHLAPGALRGGFIGVDIFFVISGFLITGLVVRERESSARLRLGSFWSRRARRLVPALALLVLVCCSCALIMGGDVLVHLGRQFLGAATFSSNWLAIGAGQSYFTSTTPELFRNLWSLAVEEQFYLVWPLTVVALVLVRSRRVRAVTIGVLAVVSGVTMAVLYVPGSDATRVYYGTDTHSFGLAIGAMLALVVVPTRLHRALPIAGALGVAALAAGAVLLRAESAVTYRGGLFAVAALTAVVIAGATAERSWLGRVLDIRPLRWIGNRSYGLYLWHWPVFVLVVATLPGVNRSGPGGWLLGGIALIVAAGAATFSYRFIERPILLNGFTPTVRRWLGGWRRSARGLGVMVAVILLLGGAVTATARAVLIDPGEGSAQIVIEAGKKAIAAAGAVPTPRTRIATASPTPPALSVAPTPPALPPGDQIDAIGDSVMLASAPELEAAFPGISINAVVSRQASGAPAIVQALVDSGTLRPTVLIGLGTNGPIDPAMLDQLRTTVGSNHQIVVINVQAPRGWVDGDNAELATFAQRYRNVELADWKDAISGQLGLLARDQIHPGPQGGLVYVQAVTAALQRLADLPPRPVLRAPGPLSR